MNFKKRLRAFVLSLAMISTYAILPISSPIYAEDTTTDSTSNEPWTFNVENINDITINIQGTPNAGVGGSYYFLDKDGNVTGADYWSMGNGLDENGTGSLDIQNTNGGVTMYVQVSNYFVWDSSEGATKDLSIDTLNITMDGVPTVPDTPTVDVPYLLGDVNLDGTISTADVLVLKRHLLGLNVEVTISETADVNSDETVNVADLCQLKTILLYPKDDKDDDHKDDHDNPKDDNKDDDYQGDSDFITAPISQIEGSLPSQGDGNLVVFYIDFPDCTYTNKMTTEEVENVVFGDADDTSGYYPFETIKAFYNRASKGCFNLKGKVFSYTAKNSISYYNDDKASLVKECLEAFDDTTDFSTFDADGDGLIDASLFTVPATAENDYWWPCCGGFYDYDYKVDGVQVGHIITGNLTPDNVTGFNSSYSHELGHCFGLPDYYLYYSNNMDAMKGNAGYELMDADAYSDLGAFSKLMLGWYRQDQVQVYNSNDSQTYTLYNSQTDKGNCVIIPCGDLDKDYFSEYFILEYTTKENNNNLVYVDDGVRIFHIKADKYVDPWWTYLKYQNGSEFTNYDDDGIRLIRLVNDGGESFKTGDTIDGSTSGFAWYDDDENESINPNVTISIGELKDGAYTISITPNTTE